MILRGIGSCVVAIPCYRFQQPTLKHYGQRRPRNDLYGSISEAERVHQSSFLPGLRLTEHLGHNIERMDAYMPISAFDAVYLIDLCEPLLDIARNRFAKKGWTNVTVLCQDASEFSLPEWANGVDPKGSVGFITLSYSLSMVSLMCRVSFNY
jgi:hypothetical protein